VKTRKQRAEGRRQKAEGTGDESEEAEGKKLVSRWA
jgi:hypothetical protein